MYLMVLGGCLFGLVVLLGFAMQSLITQTVLKILPVAEGGLELIF